MFPTDQRQQATPPTIMETRHGPLGPVSSLTPYTNHITVYTEARDLAKTQQNPV